MYHPAADPVFFCKLVFGRIGKFYMDAPSETRHPIDVHGWACKAAFDWQYVIQAKKKMYKAIHYYESFLPPDLAVSICICTLISELPVSC